MPESSFPCFGGEYSSYGSQIDAVQSSVSCLFQTKLAGQCRIVTVTWCKNVLGGQSIEVRIDEESKNLCKIETRPWFFFKKHGCKSFEVFGHTIEVYWDLSRAHYARSSSPEPKNGYFLALVCREEIVLLLGDMQTEALRKTGANPASIKPTLLSRREHLSGKRLFSTTVRFCEGGELHEVMIECPDSNSKSNSNRSDHGNSTTNSSNNSSKSSESSEQGKYTYVREPRLRIKIDNTVVVNVKRLGWKFRGNQTIVVDGEMVEVFWDVHDWLFGNVSTGAVFMFQRIYSPSKSISDRPWLRQQMSESLEDSVGFSLFLYAWRNS